MVNSVERRKKELSLLDEILEYGRRTGQIQPAAISRPGFGNSRSDQRIMELLSNRAPVEPTAQDSWKGSIEELARLEGRDVEDIEQQFRIREHETGGEGGGPLDMAKGFLGRTFDILSRGQYAVAEAVRRNQEEDRAGKGGFENINTIDDMLEGFWGGLSGKKKTSFTDVAEEAGMPGGWQRSALGFAGDIALDPTTYIGAGLIKAPAKGIARKVAAKEATEELTEAISKNLADEALKKSVRKELTDAAKERVAGKVTKKGKPVKPTKVSADRLINEITRRTTKDFLPKDGVSRVDEIAARFMSDNPGSVEFRFAGMPIYRSKGLYTAGQEFGQAIGSTKTGSLLNRAFRPVANMPDGLNNLLRKNTVANEGLFADMAMELKGIFMKLTPAQRKEIMYAIDEGTNLSHIPVKIPGHKLTNLEEYKEIAVKMFQDMGEEEKVLGLLDEDALIDNYVYRIYKKDPGDAAKATLDAPVAKKKSVAGSQSAPFQIERKFKGTLREAEQRGWEPVTDIAESLSSRYAKHFQLKSTYEFFKDGLEQFGVKTTTKQTAKQLEAEGLKKINPTVLKKSGLAKDTWLPEPIAKAMTQLEAITGKDEIAKEFMDHLDKVMGWWKFGATSVNPGFHARNSMTDVFLNMSDGVKTIKPYKTSAQILKARKARLVAQGLSSTGIAHELPKALRIKIGNEFLTDEDIWNLFVRAGGKSGYIKAEVDQLVDQIVSKGGKLKGKGKATKSKIMDISETREDFFRLAHFVDSLEKTALERKIPIKKNGVITQELTEVADEAAKRVRKFNIDYGDKTILERKAFSRAIPFYTWMRKNLPLQLELLLTKPGFMAKYPKGQRFLTNLTGSDENGDTLVPDWIKEMAPFRIRTEGKSNFMDQILKVAGIPEGAAAVGTMGSTPIMDLQRLDPIIGNLAEGKFPDIGRVAGQLASESHPLIKGAFEGATGRYTFNGAPIASAEQWAANQIPIGRQAYGMMSGNPDTRQNSAFRWATGMPIMGITEQMQQSEFRRREDYLQPMTQAIMQKKLEEYLKAQRGAN